MFAHAQLKIKAGGLQSQRQKETGQFQVCQKEVHTNLRCIFIYHNLKTENAAELQLERALQSEVQLTGVKS